jgi:hypothetical protein
MDSIVETLLKILESTSFWVFMACTAIFFIFKYFGSPGRAAKKIKQNIEGLYVSNHEFRITEPENFPNLDHQFYQSTQKKLEAHNFKFIAHIEDVTINNMKICGVRTFITSMSNSDGTICAGFYDPRPTGLMVILSFILRLKMDPCIDLETSFSDGVIMTTSNAEMAGNMTQPPKRKARFLKSGTPVEDILQLHLRRIKDYQDLHPEVEIKIVDTYEKVIAEQQYGIRMQSEFRKKIGTVTPQELKRCGGLSGKNGQRTIDQVYQEIQSLEKEESPKPPPLLPDDYTKDYQE